MSSSIALRVASAASGNDAISHSGATIFPPSLWIAAAGDEQRYPIPLACDETATDVLSSSCHLTLQLGRSWLESMRDCSYWQHSLCDESVPSPTLHVSERHCEVSFYWSKRDAEEWELTSCKIKDLKSQHGTHCNGVRLLPFHPYEVHGNRCVICLGGVVDLVASQSHHDANRSALLKGTEQCPLLQKVTFVHCEVQTDPQQDEPTASARGDEQQPLQLKSSSKRVRSKSTDSTVLLPRRGESQSASSKRVVIIDDDSPEKEHQQRVPCETPQTNNSVGIPSMATLSASLLHPMVIITTGTRLSEAERSKCSALGLIVNPPMNEYYTAKYLIIEPPLTRSVKLLTAIPYVESFLSRAWLDAVISSGRLSVPIASYEYTETYTRRGIEAANGFRIHELANFSSPVSRQCLLDPWDVFVHPMAQPQEEPINDMKQVVVASGGKLVSSIAGADLIILPVAPLDAKNKRELIAQAKGCESVQSKLFITVEDLFRAVLQQRRPVSSTVHVLQDVSPAAVPGSATMKTTQPRRSSARKTTQRASTRTTGSQGTQSSQRDGSKRPRSVERSTSYQ